MDSIHSRHPDRLALLAVAGISDNDSDDGASEALRECRMQAILQEFAELVALQNDYLSGVPEIIYCEILSQKIRYILSATNMEQVRQICRVQRPTLSTGVVTNEHPYPILEEELIGWLIASIKLPNYGPPLRRFQEVMLEVSKKHPQHPVLKKWLDYLNHNVM